MLGDAIIKAAELTNRRRFEEAATVYRDLLRLCTSNYYRRIAVELLEVLAEMH